MEHQDTSLFMIGENVFYLNRQHDIDSDWQQHPHIYSRNLSRVPRASEQTTTTARPTSHSTRPSVKPGNLARCLNLWDEPNFVVVVVVVPPGNQIAKVNCILTLSDTEPSWLWQDEHPFTN